MDANESFQMHGQNLMYTLSENLAGYEWCIFIYFGEDKYVILMGLL